MTVGVHRLRQADFDSVAIGQPSAEAVRTLMRGQHSRRLLLLRLVLDAARRGGHGTLADDAVGILGAVQASAPDEYEAVIRYPYVGAWAAQTLRAAGDPAAFAAHVGYLANVAVAAASRAGIATDLPPQVRSGVAHLPTVGSTVDGRRRPVRVIQDDGGPILFDDLDPYRTPAGMVAAERVDDAGFERWSALVRAGRRLLAGRDRADAPILRAITPLAGRVGPKGMSATARTAFGSIVLTMPEDATAYAVTDVHEVRHNMLNALLDLVPLIDPGDAGRHYAPWRSDPRPLLGLLHGTYAFIGVADFWSDKPVGDARARFELVRTSAQVAAALRTLGESTGLLAAGRRFVDGMRESFAPGRADPHEARLARLAVEDHRCGWRLRNVRPDESAAQLAADSWLAGDRPAPRPAAGELATTSETFTAAARQSLLGWVAEHPSGPAELRAGRLPEHWAALTSADLDLADGELDAAAASYLAQIDRDADDLAAWSGLAVCRAGIWGEHPEWVRAVYRALRARDVRPPVDELAAWLAT
jgi:hypothetical protein